VSKVCDREDSIKKRPWPIGAVAPWGKKIGVLKLKSIRWSKGVRHNEKTRQA
jgi:hypothetical protein